MSITGLTHANCPACGRAVTHFSVLPEDAYDLAGALKVMPIPQEFIVWPCGDRVRSYTIDLGTGTVDWNTL